MDETGLYWVMECDGCGAINPNSLSLPDGLEDISEGSKVGMVCPDCGSGVSTIRHRIQTGQRHRLQ